MTQYLTWVAETYGLLQLYMTRKRYTSQTKKNNVVNILEHLEHVQFYRTATNRASVAPDCLVLGNGLFAH
jgi:hypothetical protein